MAGRTPRSGSGSGSTPARPSGAGADYVGIDINRAARIEAAAHGGQIVVSDATRALAARRPRRRRSSSSTWAATSSRTSSRSSSTRSLAPGLERDFPPLRSLDARFINLQPAVSSFIGRAREVAEVEPAARDDAPAHPDRARRHGQDAPERRGRPGVAGRLTRPGPRGSGCRRSATRRSCRARSRPSSASSTRAPATSSTASPSGSARTACCCSSTTSSRSCRRRRSSTTSSARCPGLTVLVDQPRGPPPGRRARVPGPAPRPARPAARRRPGRPGGERGRRPVRRPGPGGPARLRPRRRQRGRGRRDLRPPRRPAAGDRAGRRAGPDPRPGGASRPASTSRSGCCPAARATCRSASRRCAARSPGATTCCPRPSGRSSSACRSSPAAGRSRPPTDVADPDGELGMDALDGLTSLVEKSLVRGVETAERRAALPDAPDDPRVRSRAAGRERGARGGPRSPPPGDRRRWPRPPSAELVGTDTKRWLDRLELEHDNVRAALRWALESGQAEIGMLTAGRLWRFWHQRGHLGEGLAMTRELLACPAGQGRTAGPGQGAQRRRRPGLLAERLPDRRALLRRAARGEPRSSATRPASRRPTTTWATSPPSRATTPSPSSSTSRPSPCGASSATAFGLASGLAGLGLVLYLKRDWEGAPTASREALVAGRAHRRPLPRRERPGRHRAGRRWRWATSRSARSSGLAALDMFAESGDPTGTRPAARRPRRPGDARGRSRARALRSAARRPASGTASPEVRRHR